MHSKLQQAKAYARAHIEDPACICYGVRAAMADGRELFNLSNADLVELHAFVCDVLDHRQDQTPQTKYENPWSMMRAQPKFGIFAGWAGR